MAVASTVGGVAESNLALVADLLLLPRDLPRSMPAPEVLKRFIAASFRSVWSLELLLLLKRSPGLHERSDLIAQLRASELVVQQSLDGLVAAGLAVVDGDGRAEFRPASPDLLTRIEEVEELYAKKPDAVRRTIVGGSTSGLDAFSNAFLLRGN